MKFLEIIAAKLTDLVTIPPVVTGNRLEIHNRLKLLLEEDGVTAMTSSTWQDGCRVIPFRPVNKSIKGSRGKKVK